MTEDADEAAGSLTGADLTQLVMAGAGIDVVSAFLDGLTHDQRLAQVHRSPRRMQGKLFDLAADGPPLTLDYFVPQDVPDGRPVVHHGFNSLPLPGFGRRFRKPMARSTGHPGQLYGYNDSPFTPLIGPGYFLHTPTLHKPHWPSRGGTVIDYWQIPDHDVPAHWPRVRKNSRGLQFFVYDKTRDFMRRVSSHVTIGAAFKYGRRIGAHFILVREDR